MKKQTVICFECKNKFEEKPKRSEEVVKELEK